MAFQEQVAGNSIEIQKLDNNNSRETQRHGNTSRRVKNRKYQRNDRLSTDEYKGPKLPMNEDQYILNYNSKQPDSHILQNKEFDMTSTTTNDMCCKSSSNDSDNLLFSNNDRISLIHQPSLQAISAKNEMPFLSDSEFENKSIYHIKTRRKDFLPPKHAIRSFLSHKKPFMSQYFMIGLFFATFLTLLNVSEACNEAICGSIVSKCTLLKSCECEITSEGCDCCKTCFMCLDYLQTDCCSCVGLCPRPNNTAVVPSQKSKVMDFNEPVPSLWNALTDGSDDNDRWSVEKYPVDFTTSELTQYQQNQLRKIKKSNPLSKQEEIQSVLPPNPTVVTLNCTVTYLRQCMAENKCETSCQSMGASSYRWFGNGCCECVGHNCKNYGINESKCLECGDDDEDVLEEAELTEEELDRAIAEQESEIEALN